MQIPPQKKSEFYIIGALILLAGLVLGAFFTSYSLYKNKALFCAVASKDIQKIREATAPFQVKNQLERVTSLQPNQIIFGKVVSKENNRFVLETAIANPEEKSVSTTTVSVPFDSRKDQALILKQTPSTSGSASSTLQTAEASFEEMKVGDQVWVNVLKDKKVLYFKSP